MKKNNAPLSTLKQIALYSKPTPGFTLRFCFVFVIATVLSVSSVQCQAQLSAAGASGLWFDQIIGIENSGIINGPEYKIHILSAKSHPFFTSGEIKGMIRYNGEVFFAPLVFDIYKDEIIVKHLAASGRAWMIQLEKKFVDEFVISDRLFRKFDRGFHEVLYEGDNFLLVARRSKEIYLRKGISDYIESNRFFVIASGQWKPLRNKAGFMNMMSSKAERKKFRLFLKENDIKVRRFKNEDMFKVGTFINALRSNKSQ